MEKIIKKIILAMTLLALIITISACSKNLSVSGKKKKPDSYNVLVSTKRKIAGKRIIKDYGTYCRTFKYSGSFKYLLINKKIYKIIKPEAEKVGANAYLNMIMASSYYASQSSKTPVYSVHVCGELVKLN
ncbi:MAG: hypothetical protein ACYCTB_03740 [bacterium]